jgi:alanyl-tRNA synthetase
MWCDRSREQVRWDEFQPECSARPELPDIETVIHNEEAMFNALIQKGKEFIPKFIKKHGMSGESLAILHHTHGYDPETVISVVEFDEREHLPGYEAAMAEHRRKSGNFGEF